MSLSMLPPEPCVPTLCCCRGESGHGAVTVHTAPEPGDKAGTPWCWCHIVPRVVQLHTHMAAPHCDPHPTPHTWLCPWSRCPLARDPTNPGGFPGSQPARGGRRADWDRAAGPTVPRGQNPLFWAGGTLQRGQAGRAAALASCPLGLGQVGQARPRQRRSERVLVWALGELGNPHPVHSTGYLCEPCCASGL